MHRIGKITVVFLFTLSLLRISHAALLVLPSGESHTLLWERALVVHDELSRQQTVIAEVAVKGSPRHFAILIATPQVASLDYITTRIWRYLHKHLKPRVTTQRSLSLTSEWLISRLISTQELDPSSTGLRRDVLRSYNTQIHRQERALHDWLVKRGLVLTPDQALSIKRAYRTGAEVVSLWVRTPKDRLNRVKEIWTSTWVFSHEADSPHYLALFPESLTQRYGRAVMTSSSTDTSPQLRLTFLTDTPLSKLLNNREHASFFQSVPSHHVVDRMQVKELNQTLGVHRWSYNRRGVLSAFELDAPAKMMSIKVNKDSDMSLNEPKVVVKKQEYKLTVPIEPCLLLIVIGVWYRKRLRSRW